MRSGPSGLCTLEGGAYHTEALAGKKESTEDFEKSKLKKKEKKKEPFWAD